MNHYFMKPLKRLTGVTFLLAALVLAGCDTTSALQSSTTDSADGSEIAAAISQELGLSPAETQSLEAALASLPAQPREPGILWRVAAELQPRLSESQMAALRNRMEQADARTPGGRGFGPGPGMSGERGFGQGPGTGGGRGFRQGPGRMGDGAGPGFGGGHAFGGGPMGAELDLSDEQRSQIEAIRKKYAPQMRALAQTARESEAPGDVRAEMEALRETMHAEVSAVLTDAQREQLEAWRQKGTERREEARERQRDRLDEARSAMVDALGLTAEQQAALEALRSERRAQMPRAGFAGLCCMEELEQILTEEQMDILLVHRYLSARQMQQFKARQMQSHSRRGRR